MKDELSGKTMTTFVALRTKTYSYLIDEVSEDKRGKEANKCGMSPGFCQDFMDGYIRFYDSSR